MMASEVTPDPFGELTNSPPPNTDCNKKKTWEELRQSVREVKKLQAQLVNRVPTAFSFRTYSKQDGSTCTRMYFLGVPSGSRENTLMYTDIDSTTQDTNICNLEWKQLLDSFHAAPSDGTYSKEEQLLRERKRLGSFGITSYDVDVDTGKFVFPACSSLYTCIDDPTVDAPVFPSELKSCTSGVRLDPKICPNNTDLIGYIQSNDVWVVSEASGVERRVTFAHKGLQSVVQDPKSAGVPSFVVQEEFDRYTGYWWQPEQTHEAGKPKKYRILYEEVDESDVDILHIVSATNDERGVDDYRYPKAGSTNAKSTLKLVEIELDENGGVSETIVDKQLPESLQSLFPWMEYIVRVGWTPSGTHVWAQLLSRNQCSLSIIVIPVECFIECSPDVEMKSCDGCGSAIKTIYEEWSDVWININDTLHFLETDQDEWTFIFASERTGFRHLYYVTAQYDPSLGSDELMIVESGGELEFGYRAHNMFEPITSGEWEVLGKQIWVDERNQFVYFLGLKDSLMETHMYVASYSKPGNVQRLTELGFSHGVAMDKDCTMYVTLYSSIKTAPAGQVFSIQKDESGQMMQQSLGTLLQFPTSSFYHPPEIFSYVSSASCKMFGMCYKPHNFELGKKYPTVLFVYGGPQVQLVNNSFKGLRFLRLQMLASQGYAVVVIDNRGSCQRGLHFEGAIKNRMGTVEVEEQVEGLQYIASQVDFIDLSRVAIHGWSYGGYMSLMGLAQRPDVFKVAVAGAPVTSWNLYDTGYTERYMDTPQRNTEGYHKGSVLSYVDNFPSEENRLLIVHGLIDENVHFYHTNVLINALIKACKPYKLQVYPNERHGIRNPEASEHYETMVLSFLQHNL